MYSSIVTPRSPTAMLRHELSNDNIPKERHLLHINFEARGMESGVLICADAAAFDK